MTTNPTLNPQNRAQMVDYQFIHRVKNRQLPAPFLDLPLSLVGLTTESFLDLFESQMISRLLDLEARVLKAQNESFYTIGSSGHEGNAAIAKAFRLSDMSFLHYRSGAYMVQKAKQLPGSTPLYDGLLSLVASSEDPISGGRHKVFGSVPLYVPPQTSTIASHLPKALGAAFSIPKQKILSAEFPVLTEDASMPHDAVVVCSFGDASLNHSTAQGALNAASWCSIQNIPLPLVFVCEDNGIGISVPTPQDWVEMSCAHRPGIKYFQCNGLDLVDTYAKAFLAADYARTHRRPVFLHMKTVRLLGHAGSDIETTYHTMQEIEACESYDPLLFTAARVLAEGMMKEDDIISMYENFKERLHFVAKEAVARPKLQTIEAVAASIIPPASSFKMSPPLPAQEDRLKVLGSDLNAAKSTQHMAKLINMALHDLLLRYPQIMIFGEDVAKKGGVYNVTTNLYKRFGAKRVFNSLLDEQTILGTAIGLAHNGFLPIPEIQFLAYFHNAEDQIRGEAATLSFFSSGKYTNPMVLRVAGLAYQKGFGGHYHNDNSINVFRDIPGIILACPSNGEDAVKMLRTCVKLAYEQRRVVIFLEPIALYMTKDLHDKNDSGWSFPYPPLDEETPYGEVGIFEEGPNQKKKELTIMTYANGYYYSRQAVKELKEKYGIHSKVIDLRWLVPLAEKEIIKAVEGSEHILIVEECRQTGSLSEELVALLVKNYQQKSSPLPPIKVLAAADCFIPLGVAASAGLPKKEEIIIAAKELLNLK